MAPSIPNLTIGWTSAVSSTVVLRETAPDSNYRHKVGWAPAPVWTFWRSQNSRPSILLHAANIMHVHYTIQHNVQMTVTC